MLVNDARKSKLKMYYTYPLGQRSKLVATSARNNKFNSDDIVGYTRLMPALEQES